MSVRSLFILFLSVAAGVASACTVVVVGRDVSPTGRVIVGHNEDNSPPAWIKYGILPATPETHRTFWCECKVSSGDANGDFFLNDRGVVVVSNSGGVSRERQDDPALLVDGGVGYEIRREAGLRARSARDAVRIIGELVERRGYRPSARIYTVADAREAWQVQIVHGRNYVAVRCPDDAVTVLPNMYTVRNLSDWPAGSVVMSTNLLANARAKGFWNGRDPFDFAAAYQGPGVPHANSIGRARQAIRLVTGEDWPEGDTRFPFALKPKSGTFGTAEVKALLTAHNEPSRPGAHVFTSWSICSSSTIRSEIFELTDDPSATVCHLVRGRGCESPYVRCRPFAEPLPSAFDQSVDAVRRMADHLKPVKEDLP